MSGAPPAKTCEQCGRPLDYIVNRDGSQGYAHANQALGSHDEDHVPIPVDPTVENTIPWCDFCMWPILQDDWTVECKPFQIEVNPGLHQNMSALWAACPRCVRLIRKGRWRALEARAVRMHLKQQPDLHPLQQVVVADYLAQLFAAVHENFVEVRRSRPGEINDDNRFGDLR